MKITIFKMGLAFATIFGSVTQPNDILTAQNDKNSLQTNTMLDLVLPPGMPVRIETVALEDNDASKMKYRITNLSDGNITAIKWRILFFAHGMYKNTEEQVDVITVPPKSTKDEYVYLDNNVDNVSHLAIGVEEVVGLSGVWSVPSPALEARAKAQVMNQSCEAPTARYEPNQTITDKDKAEIYQNVLEQLFSRKELLEMFSLENKERLILSRENINFTFSPQVSGIVFSILEPDEIQRNADQAGLVSFLRFGSVEAEGSNVKVTLEYLKRAKAGKSIIPCCGGYVFFYRRESDSWIVKDVSKYRIL